MILGDGGEGPVQCGDEELVGVLMPGGGQDHNVPQLVGREGGAMDIPLKSAIEKF